MTEITPDHHSCETTQLSYQSWKLVITQLAPFRFELFNHDKLTFRGELQIILVIKDWQARQLGH